MNLIRATDTLYFLPLTEMEYTATSSANTNAILITGETYTSRRDIKAMGGKWYPDRTGWIVPISRQEAAKKIAGDRGFTTEVIEVDVVALERPAGVRLRNIRQERLDRKIGLWRARAVRLKAEAAAIEKQIEPYDDWAFWTEPIKIGHHSEQRHRNLRERLRNKDIKRLHLLDEARELTEKADLAERSGARIAGDKERERQAKREAMDSVICVGTRVIDCAFGGGTVIRVNKKSYSICFDSGSTFARDKSYIRPAA